MAGNGTVNNYKRNGGVVSNIPEARELGFKEKKGENYLYYGKAVGSVFRDTLSPTDFVRNLSYLGYNAFEAGQVYNRMRNGEGVRKITNELKRDREKVKIPINERSLIVYAAAKFTAPTGMKENEIHVDVNLKVRSVDISDDLNKLLIKKIEKEALDIFDNDRDFKDLQLDGGKSVTPFTL